MSRFNTKKFQYFKYVLLSLIVALIAITITACAKQAPQTEEELNRSLEGNSLQYDFSTIQKMENSPVQGKNFFILGSSVAYGAASFEQAVGEYLCDRLGMNLTKEAVSGTTLVNDGEQSYVSRLQKPEYANTKYDFFLCQLSTNDATKKLPLGQISTSTNLKDFDTSTITGAIEYIVCYAKQSWNCPVYFFTGSYYDSNEYSAMVQQLKEISKKWNFTILNLWDNKDFNNLSSETRKLYMRDDIHPTKAGYKDWWGPELEKQFLATLK